MVFIMGFPDDQNINPVAAAVFYDVPFHGFPTCRAGRRILLDDCEILQAVRKQNLRAVQCIDSREFAIKSRGEAEQHQDKDAGESRGVPPGSADPVQQEQSRRGEKQKNEQQQTEEMCQEIVKSFRKFRLIDRLNGVIGELASVCDVMRNNCQREQIQQETENQCRQNPERAVDASQKIAAYGIGSPAPDCKEHCKIQLADGIELLDRRKIEPFTEQENRRKGKIDHPRPRIAADQGAGKSGGINRRGDDERAERVGFNIVSRTEKNINCAQETDCGEDRPAGDPLFLGDSIQTIPDFSDGCDDMVPVEHDGTILLFRIQYQ